MGTYVYAVKKSKPYTVKGIPPIYRLEYITKPYWDEDIYSNKRIGRITQAWGDERPELITLHFDAAKIGKPILTAVYQKPNTLIWWDCDEIPGTQIGWLFVGGKKKQFLTNDETNIIIKKTTGFNTLKEASNHADKYGCLTLINTDGAEIFKAYYNNYGFRSNNITYCNANEQIGAVV